MPVLNNALAAAALLLSATNSRHDTAIEKTASVYLKAVLAQDAAAVAATFREDAVLMPDCRSMIQGRASIEQFYQGFFASALKITEFTFSHLETAASGDQGFTAGTYNQTLVPKPGGTPVHETGKFVVIVKKDAGGWKAAYVIYNNDHLPALAMSSPYPGILNAIADSMHLR